MTTVNFTNPRAQFLDRNGNPLSGGRVWFYVAGESTTKAIYTTAQGDVLNENPNILDAEGFVTPDTGVHLSSGLYDIHVEEATGLTPVDQNDPSDPAWAPYWTYPDIQGTASTTGGNTLLIGYVNSIAELRALPAGSYNMVFVAGYYANGDTGARWVKWDGSNSEDDNGGTIFSTVGASALGRFLWLPQATDTVVTPQLFGALPSNGSLVIASQIDSMINWCENSNHKNIHYNVVGDYWVNSTSTHGAGLNVTIDTGVEFKNASGQSSMIFDCESLAIKGASPVVAPKQFGASMGMEIRTTTPMNVRPEWWSVDPTTVSDSSWVLNHIAESIDPTMTIEFSGTHNANGTTIDYSEHNVLFNKGAYLECTGSEVMLSGVVSLSTTPVFTGNSLGVVEFTEGFARSEWLDWKIDDIDNEIKPFLNDFISTNTNNGGKQFTFEVGEGIANLDYNITEETRGNTFHYNFNWDFTGGSIFGCTADGFIEFGYVSSVDERVFSTVSSGDYKMRFLNDIKLSWFGGISHRTDTVTNQNAIRSAYSQVVSSNGSTNQSYSQRITLDLDGGTFKTGAVATVFQSGYSDAIIPVKNGTIWSDEANASYLLGFAHGIEATNVKFECRGGNVRLLGTDRGTIKFTRSELIGKDTLIDSLSTDKLVLKDCDLYITDIGSSTHNIITHDGENSVIKDCTLRRIQSGTTGSTSAVFFGKGSRIDNCECEGVTIITQGLGSITNNRLDKASIACNNPSNMVITGNSLTTSDFMDAKIVFSSASSAYQVEGIVCTGNSFINGCSNPTTRADYVCIDSDFSGGTGSASYAEVHSNFIGTNLDAYRYLYAGTTRFEVELDHYPGYPTWGTGIANWRLSFFRTDLTATQRFFAIFSDYELHNVNLTMRAANGSVIDEEPIVTRWLTRRNASPPIVDIDIEIQPNDFTGDLYVTFETTNLQRLTNAKVINNPLFS